MPMIWVEPEEFMATEGGVIVYHDYGDGYDSPMRFWYQIEADEFETNFARFDVRELLLVVGLPVHRIGQGDLERIRGAINAAERALGPLDEILRQNDLWSEGNG